VGQVDLIVTEMGVFKITDKGMMLTELAPEFSVEEVQAATEAQLIVSPSLIPMPTPN
jgi:acetate CoA/acetoacetate CoA-transferase beta subunit